ncbi:MAG: uroporphyrinogen decarboxylase family protein [Phycisphaerae bacterium]|nr:uroporphyrinogen decarboxylase family protein [Phycisphaerae bacterium]
MTSRERVVRSLNFQPTDRPAKDLGAMRSTGVSAFAYPRLRAALGLPPRLPRVYDLGQMLALIDVDVLDALGCDVVAVEGDGVTNAFDQPELWKPYDFGGRLPALVRDPSQFRTESDGTVVAGASRMPTASYVFTADHAGQPLILDAELPKPDLKAMRQRLAAPVTDEQVVRLRDNCRRVRESTDRAVLLWGPLNLGLCIHSYGGLAVFPIICLQEPDFVHELHSMVLDAALARARAYLPEIKDYVDCVGIDADDWGTQASLIASPATFRDLFLPYRRRHNDEIHRLAPHIKTFLHSCGALYNLLDLIVATGTDALNPVQWPAGGHTPAEWKAKVRGRMSFWGGGVNSQVTLPLGSVEDVRQEVARTVPILADGGGYVFCNVHNLLAEIPPEKIIAMYRAAGGAT